MMMLTGAGDFAGNLGLVTGILPPLTSFTTVQMDKEYIFVEGITNNPFTVLNYAWALGAEAFNEVRIVEIDEIVDEEENTSIFYLIEVTR
jgi:hypothetical protein